MKALSILIVDDDAIIGSLLGELLEFMGHAVCAIETTEAGAIAAAGRLKPDLLIVDANLGEGSGINAVRVIIKAWPTPYLFVSGDLSGVKAAMPYAAMVRKPYNEDELSEGIRRAMSASLEYPPRLAG